MGLFGLQRNKRAVARARSRNNCLASGIATGSMQLIDKDKKTGIFIMISPQFIYFL